MSFKNSLFLMTVLVSAFIVCNSMNANSAPLAGESGNPAKIQVADSDESTSIEADDEEEESEYARLEISLPEGADQSTL